MTRRIAASTPEQELAPPESVDRDGPAPLRILEVVEAFSTGVYETVRQIANAAASAGHDVHVAHALRPWTPAHFTEEFDSRITFHRLAWGPRRTAPRLARGTAELRTLLRREWFDVVHTHSTFAGLATALVRPNHLATIHTPHGYVFLMSSMPPYARAVGRGAERFVGRRAAALGAVSNAEADEARRLGIDRVVVIRNGIAELDAPAGSHAQATARLGVVAAGRMSAQRQPHVVAEIFRALAPGTPRAWLGDTRDEETARELRSAGAELTGWLDREAVLARLRHARVYLHWTGWDGHPLSVLEAIAMGAVVVAHDIPPVREMLGDAGVCAAPDEAVRLIGRLLADDAFHAELRQRQAALVAGCSGRQMAARWLDRYAVLGGRATPVGAPAGPGPAR